MKEGKTMRFIIISILLSTIIGCSAAGVVQTNDPYQKVRDAHTMMQQGRGIPAERFATEALTEFTTKGDKFGEGEANVALGLLYKSQLMKNNDKSIKHFKQAINAFESINDYAQLAKAKFGLANAYGSNNQKEELCQMYKESLNDYKTSLITNPNSKFEFNPRFKSFDEMVEGFRSHYCN